MANINLIFDFDGTLVDSFSMIIEKYNILAEEFHFKRIDPYETDILRDLTSRELVKYLNIPFYKIPQLLLRARALIAKEIYALQPFPQMCEVMSDIHDMKINLGVVTSNSLENVTVWLKQYSMFDYFSFIHVDSNFFGKRRVLKKILRSYRLDYSKTFYIGDETRDIEAAKACGVYSVAVTWGFNSEAILREHQPYFLARKPEDLKSIFI